MLPLFAIWYAMGLYALVLTAVEVVRRVRDGQSWRRVLVTCAAPVLLGFAIFVSWPMVAWALARSP